MEWRAINFDWNRTRAFLAVAEAGSLSAAARALGATQPTVGRQVAALEVELGVALFERAGRGMRLAPAGLDLLEHVRAMAEAAGRVSLAASGRTMRIEGPVTIACSEMVAAKQMPPILARLAELAPAITIEIVASDAISDLRRREADIAVRHVRPSDPELIARKVNEVGAWLYAAPEYLERIGRPAEPGDLSDAAFVGTSGPDQIIDALNRLGFSLSDKNIGFRCDSEIIRWEMVKQGLGIGALTEDIGDLEPAVVKALPSMGPIMVPFWIVAHRELRTSRRFGLVFDLLCEAFSN